MQKTSLFCGCNQTDNSTLILWHLICVMFHSSAFHRFVQFELYSVHRIVCSWYDFTPNFNVIKMQTVEIRFVENSSKWLKYSFSFRIVFSERCSNVHQSITLIIHETTKSQYKYWSNLTKRGKKMGKSKTIHRRIIKTKARTQSVTSCIRNIAHDLTKHIATST